MTHTLYLAHVSIHSVYSRQCLLFPLTNVLTAVIMPKHYANSKSASSPPAIVCRWPAIFCLPRCLPAKILSLHARSWFYGHTSNCGGIKWAMRGDNDSCEIWQEKAFCVSLHNCMPKSWLKETHLAPGKIEMQFPDCYLDNSDFFLFVQWSLGCFLLGSYREKGEEKHVCWEQCCSACRVGTKCNGLMRQSRPTKVHAYCGRELQELRVTLCPKWRS